MNLTKGLNPEQKKAVRADEGVHLVLAGAGTGKTRVLVHRAAYLVKTGVRPERIVLLTFTRKAADEMVYRASKIGSGSCKRIQSGTFHSFCLDLLKRYGSQIGLTKFTLLDGPTAEDAMRSVRNTYMKENDIPARGFPRAGTLSSIASFSTETKISVGTAIETRWPDYEAYGEHISFIIEEYRKYKVEHKYIDFSDILLYAVDLLKTSFMQRLAKTDYEYLMIDEYQDTNVMQDEIVRLLSVNGNLMVVGDDMQSIYGFRGAHAENIIEFPERWPKANIIKLVRNYRSYEQILDVANSISADAVSRPELFKELVAFRGEGPRPQLHIAECRFSQAEYVKRHIDRLVESGVAPKDIAVLFRSGSTSNELETILNADSVEYAKYGGLRFSETKHVRDVLAYMKVLFNSRDSLSWQRILGLLPGIGPALSSRITSYIVDQGNGSKGLKEAPDATNPTKYLHKTLAKARKRGLSVFDRLYEIIDHYQQFLVNDPDQMKRLADLDSLLEIAKNYRSSSKLLEDLTMEPPREKVEELLTLSTIHSSKGLEWPHVVLMGVSADQMPPMYAKREEDIAEEHRMFYVGVTRAADTLLLTGEISVSEFVTSKVRKCVDVCWEEEE